jgi:superfamily I DNA/RNA helicase
MTLPALRNSASCDAALDEDYLILSTIHSAKGQEWKSVFVLNVVDGLNRGRLRPGRRGDSAIR